MGLLIAGLVFMASASVARAIDPDVLLDSLQETAFDYFWNEANPANGLIKDRSTSWSPCSIASLGFGLSAICIGIDHGWVTREEGRERILTALNTLWTAPQGNGATGFIGYRGLYYHFLDMNTARRTWDCEVSTIDSALLFAGVLDAKQYFSTADPLDVTVRQLADSIYYRADWNFFRNLNTPILMGWKPGTGFSGFGPWIGYNEAMILYILALGSPTHAVPENAWTAWTSGYDWGTFYGYSYVYFPPLFGHQYSHCWIDFRYIQDDFCRFRDMTYFENSRRATLAAREYCIDNPNNWIGYGPNVWGLTACDGPNGYRARGAPPPQNDDGTIAPTAAGGSIPFAPEVCIPALQNMYDAYGADLWSIYGFKDAFNLSVDWWGPDYIGIDEGPFIVMIENYRNGGVWNRFMANPDVQLGLQRAGFEMAVGIHPELVGFCGQEALAQSAPNPFRDMTTIRFVLDVPGMTRVWVSDVSGRQVARLASGWFETGSHTVTLVSGELPSGVYYYNLEHNGNLARRSCVLIR